MPSTSWTYFNSGINCIPILIPLIKDFFFKSLNELPDFGLPVVHGGVAPPVDSGPAPLSSSLNNGGSSSLSVKSSVPDSTPDCSGDVTFTSSSFTSTGGGSVAWFFSGGEGGVFVDVASSFFSVSWCPSDSASFCFWSCSFCRLRCFLRNFARLFLNQT